MLSERHLIIVGTGVAGCAAALSARAANGEAQITLIGAEPHVPYDRTHLSKYQLMVDANLAGSELFPVGSFEREHIDLRTGIKIIGINPDTKMLTLSNDETMSYDVLILATGSIARPIPEFWNALPASRIHSIRVAEDANRLRKALINTRKLVIIGAGLIGLEVAAAARARQIEVTVVDTASRILARSCDEATASRVAHIHQDHGVILHLKASITGVGVTSNGNPELTLSDGTTLIADHIVIGIGVLPDTALAEMAHLDINNGILVDVYGQTSHPNIYAAGDVACLPLSHNTYPVRLETWRHAQEHGRQVGANAVGLKQAYDRPPSFWSDQYSHRIQGVGLITDDEVKIVVRYYDNGTQLSFLLASDQTLRAVIGLDCGKDVNAVGRLVGLPIPVSARELADPSLPLSQLVKSLLKSRRLKND